MRNLSLVMVGILLFCELMSCTHYATQPNGCDTCKTPCDTCQDTTHHPCDTCNIDKDSLQRVKDSLSHAWTWTELTIPGEAHLTGTWVFDSTNVLIVGNNLWQFDGKAFTDLHPIRNGSNTPMDGGLNGSRIFAFSPMDYWFIDGGILFRTNDGFHFDDYRPGPSFNAGWGKSSNDMFFVGNSGYIYHYDGSTFTRMDSVTNVDLFSVWGTDDNHIWACGQTLSTGENVMIYNNGSHWSREDFSNDPRAESSGLWVTWAIDSGNGHQLTLASGARLFRNTDNQNWRQDTLKSNISQGHDFFMLCLDGQSATDFFAAGENGFIAHWNDKTWSSYDLFSPSLSNFETAQFSQEGNTACGAGRKNGQGWVAYGRRKQ